MMNNQYNKLKKKRGGSNNTSNYQDFCLTQQYVQT